jgi:hypothetical protein
MSDKIPSGFFYIIFLFHFGIAGCAALPQTMTVSEPERQTVAAAFTAMTTAQQDCRSFDADATVTYESFLRSGTIPGYLQAMSPSYLKFVGVNPFGQPVVILVTDGVYFRYVAVHEAKWFEGSVRAETFEKYAPKGFNPEDSYFWLTGRLAFVSEEDLSVSKDTSGVGYWVDIGSGPGATRSLVLFDPDEMVVLRRIEQDVQGETVMDVLYDEYLPGECNRPGRIAFGALKNNGSMEIVLSDYVEESLLSESDFEFDPPSGFERMIVK